VEPLSQVQRVARELRAQLTTGGIAPGTRLSQTELAARFGVSRVPLREALQQLAGQGLVRLESGGAVVATPLSVAELQEVYEIREAVEPLLARLAVPNAGRAEILRMRATLERMGEAAQPREWMRLNREFHRTLYACVDRPRLRQIVDLHAALADRYVYVQIDGVGETAEFDRQHRRILSAVADGDAALAAKLTKEHLESSHEFVLRYFLEREPDPGDPAAT
jgi:Transcriptional regulators